jgi:hypothetical protein
MRNTLILASLLAISATACQLPATIGFTPAYIPAVFVAQPAVAVGYAQPQPQPQPQYVAVAQPDESAPAQDNRMFAARLTGNANRCEVHTGMADCSAACSQMQQDYFSHALSMGAGGSVSCSCTAGGC